MTRKELFRRYGLRLLNLMTDWSALSSDGLVVALSLWLDEFRGRAGAMVYEKLDTRDWMDAAAKRRFFRHLQHSLHHCGGLVRVVVSVRDPANHARTVDCYPVPNVIMRITRLDVAAGSFRLEQVVPGSMAA